MSCGSWRSRANGTPPRSWSRRSPPGSGGGLPEEVVFRGQQQVTDRPVAQGRTGAADEGGWAAGGLAEGELRRGGDLVGHGPDRRAHRAPVMVGGASKVLQGADAGHADRDVDDAQAPWPSERVRDHD